MTCAREAIALLQHRERSMKLFFKNWKRKVLTAATFLAY
jgi:hypothetical protein